MKKIFLLFFVTLFLNYSYAQVRYSCGNPHPDEIAHNSEVSNTKGVSNFGNYVLAENKIYANPENNLDQFKMAKIVLNGSSKTFYSRVNDKTNKIEIIGENNTVYNLNLIHNMIIEFEDVLYRAISYKVNNQIFETDFFEIENADSKLLKKQKIFAVEVTSNGYNGNESSRTKEKIKTEYYFFSKESDLVYLPKSKNKILKNNPSIKDDLSQFIKENKISLKDESDMNRLVTYIDDKDLERVATTRNSKKITKDRTIQTYNNNK